MKCASKKRRAASRSTFSPRANTFLHGELAGGLLRQDFTSAGEGAARSSAAQPSISAKLTGLSLIVCSCTEHHQRRSGIVATIAASGNNSFGEYQLIRSF